MSFTSKNEIKNPVIVVVTGFSAPISKSIRTVGMRSKKDPNQGEALYIINSAGIAYHQNEVLYIIIAKEIQPTADDIHATRDDIRLRR